MPPLGSPIRRDVNLRDGFELADDFGEPIFEEQTLIACHFDEGHAHPRVRLAVDYLASSLEGALVPENPHGDRRPLGERIEGVDVAAAEAYLGGACRESRVGIQVGHLSRGDEWTALYGAA